MAHSARDMVEPMTPSAADVSAPRAAAVVIALRDADDGLEVLLVKRAKTLAFYAGAWVFPGGGLEAEDGDLVNGLDAAARRAAARELKEEAGLTVDEAQLGYISRWLTPPGRNRRFDTFYFIARAPQDAVQIQVSEVEEHRWLTPPVALQARQDGAIELPPPTFVTLSELAAFTRVEDALCRLAEAPTHFIPRPVEVPEGMVYLYAADAGYETGELDLPGPRHRLTALSRGWHYQHERD
jgi:8-oxo-dGTP pyrophosphatase MutT (NUDIX family)